MELIERQWQPFCFYSLQPGTNLKNEGWIDRHDWIGFDVLPFEKARTFMRKLRLKNRDEYWAWLASGRKIFPTARERFINISGG